MVGSWCSGALTLTYSMAELGLNDPRGWWGERGHTCQVDASAFIYFFCTMLIFFSLKLYQTQSLQL